METSIIVLAGAKALAKKNKNNKKANRETSL